MRVFDGELISAVSVFNTAMLLQDAQIMRFAAQLAYSLCTQLPLFTAQDGRIMNARYQWLIDNESYLLPMQRLAILLGMLTKDQRFFDAAKRWRQSDVYCQPPERSAMKAVLQNVLLVLLSVLACLGAAELAVRCGRSRSGCRPTPRRCSGTRNSYCPPAGRIAAIASLPCR